MSREAKQARAKREGKGEMKRRLAADYIERYKDDFDECIYIFVGEVDSPAKKATEIFAVGLLQNIFIAPERTKGKAKNLMEMDRIKTFVDDNLPEAFKEEPVK